MKASLRLFLPIPILRPPAPAAAPLRIANRSGAPVTVYSIDRYGGWAWADRIGE